MKRPIALIVAVCLVCCSAPPAAETAHRAAGDHGSAMIAVPPGAPETTAPALTSSPPPSTPTAQDAPPTARLIVVVRRVDSMTGALIIGLCGDRDRWLAADGYDFGAVHRIDGADADDVAVSIENVPAGRWALSVFQDLDGDGELARGPFGIPAEPWGFGNDPPAFGAARFNDAIIDVTAPETRVVVTLRGGVTATVGPTERDRSAGSDQARPPRTPPTDATNAL